MKFQWLSPGTFLIARVAGMLLLAGIALMVPELGVERFWLAAIILFVVAPLAIWVERRFPMAETGWSEPVLDILAIIVLVHLVPVAWFAGVIIGVMVTGAYSIYATGRSHLIYLCMIGTLVIGMSFAGVIHDVPGWELPIIAILTVAPNVMFYNHWEATRARVLRERNQSLQGLAQIAGGVAHNFNNTLTGVIGFAELALMKLEPAHPASTSIKELILAANRASDLSRQLLAFSGRSLQDDHIDLGLELRTLVSLLTSSTPIGVSLDLQVEETTPLVAGDRSELQKVIMNIIMNAAEATTTKLRQIDIAVAPGTLADKPCAVIQISSRQQRTTPDRWAKLLSPLVGDRDQVQDLGLVTARQTMRGHGGDIQIDHADQGDTTVTILIPAAESVLQPPGTTVSKPEFEDGLILIIDDEPQIRALLQEYLTHMGLRSIQAGDGVEGMSQFNQHASEIMAVILDLHMPHKNGWECLQEIREQTLDLAVLIISGYDPEESRIELNDSRLKYLTKPFMYEDIESNLIELIKA